MASGSAAKEADVKKIVAGISDEQVLKLEQVHLALCELVKSSRRRDLLSFRGQVKWDGNLAELRRRPP